MNMIHLIECLLSALSEFASSYSCFEKVLILRMRRVAAATLVDA